MDMRLRENKIPIVRVGSTLWAKVDTTILSIFYLSENLILLLYDILKVYSSHAKKYRKISYSVIRSRKN